MNTTELHLAIMNRSNCSLAEADKMVLDMKEEVKLGVYPEEVLFKMGFDPDYIYDIL